MVVQSVMADLERLPLYSNEDCCGPRATGALLVGPGGTSDWCAACHSSGCALAALLLCLAYIYSKLETSRSGCCAMLGGSCTAVPWYASRLVNVASMLHYARSRETDNAKACWACKHILHAVSVTASTRQTHRRCISWLLHGKTSSAVQDIRTASKHQQLRYMLGPDMGGLALCPETDASSHKPLQSCL